MKIEYADFYIVYVNFIQIFRRIIDFIRSNRDGSNYDDFEFFNLELKGIRKTGWVLSGRVEIDNEPATYAYVCVYRHGTDERVSSCLTDNNGSYSLKLPNGVYDVKAVKELCPEFDTKTVVINNSNVTLDLKTSMFGFFPFFYFLSSLFYPLLLQGLSLQSWCMHSLKIEN